MLLSQMEERGKRGRQRQWGQAHFKMETETEDGQNVDGKNVLRTDGAMMGREESSEVGMTFGK